MESGEIGNGDRSGVEGGSSDESGISWY